MSESPAHSPARGPAGERPWLPVAVLVLGLTSIAVLVGTDQLRLRTLRADVALRQAVARVEVDVALAHLWLEEYVSGDRIGNEEIDPRLERSRQLATALGGGNTTSELPALGDPELRRRASELAAWLQAFQDLSDQRRQGYERGEEVGIGSAMDVRCDAVFAEVLSQTQQLGSALATFQEQRQQRSYRVFLAIMSIWGAVVALAAAGLWNRERHRHRAESELAASQAQLLQAQKIEAVGRLAGGLAHDLNNYLAAIRGHCELVGMQADPEGRTASRMEAVIRLVGKAAALIERLQTFSHPQPAQPQVLRLGPLVASILKLLTPSLGETIRVESELPADLWPVKVDPGQLEQVLVNLLVNARDAMPAGGEIRIRAGNLPAEHSGADHVELAVSDTGCGIPPELHDRIFEPLLTTKDRQGHSGLGLAIVYSILRQHGGRVDVESEVGRGSTFHLLLPRSHEPLTGEAAELAGASSGNPHPGGSEHLLLVDDNPDFRESTRGLLQALGYQVTTAGNGEEALAACTAAGHRFDLVLTDVVMPGLGGPELVEQIRRQRPEVRAIYISGHSEQILDRHGVERGAVQLPKNLLSADLLARTVRQLLDAGDPRQATHRDG